MKKFFSTWCIIISVLFFLTSIDFYAQGPGNGNGNGGCPNPPCGGPGPCTNPPCNPPNPPGLVPIDGGILLLLTSGLIYGVSKLRENS